MIIESQPSELAQFAPRASVAAQRAGGSARRRARDPGKRANKERLGFPGVTVQPACLGGVGAQQHDPSRARHSHLLRYKRHALCAPRLGRPILAPFP